MGEVQEGNPPEGTSEPKPSPTYQAAEYWQKEAEALWKELRAAWCALIVAERDLRPLYPLAADDAKDAVARFEGILKAHANQPHPEELKDQYWNITLNRYQRDNLLSVFNLIGYDAEAVEPFHLLDSGDWVGEIPLMLVRKTDPPNMNCRLQSDDQPNKSIAEVKKDVADWLKEKQSA